MLRILRTRWRILAVIVVLLGVPGAWLMARESTGHDTTAAVATVRRGEFRVPITVSGELRAKKAINITLPQNAQQADQYQMKISTIVPEGTVVKEGEVVAELDRSAIAAKLQEVSLALQKAQLQAEQARLDSTLTLSQAREDLRTMELALEEKRIAKEQATFEAPSVKRQAEIDFEKATRALAKAKTDYTTKTDQAIAKQREIGTDLSRQENRLKVIQDVMTAFTIKAPSAGMVIYVKEWNGRKKTAGSQVSPWEPNVATLPDLSQMESLTYVNEIDVRKVAVGQPVQLALDADPTKKLTGKVSSVANVGEQRPNADAKVFEVKIEVEQPDTTLRPGMTTSNAIETFAVKEALFIPIEAVHSDSAMAYVFKKSGSRVVKQQIETGAMNDNEIIVTAGLSESDHVLLSPPADKDKLGLVSLPGGGKPKVTPGNDKAPGATPVPVKTPEHAPSTPTATPSSTKDGPAAKAPATTVPSANAPATPKKS